MLVYLKTNQKLTLTIDSLPGMSLCRSFGVTERLCEKKRNKIILGNNYFFFVTHWMMRHSLLSEKGKKKSVLYTVRWFFGFGTKNKVGIKRASYLINNKLDSLPLYYFKYVHLDNSFNASSIILTWGSIRGMQGIKCTPQFLRNTQWCP